MVRNEVLTDGVSNSHVEDERHQWPALRLAHPSDGPAETIVCVLMQPPMSAGSHAAAAL
jgi:hypothetical protein